jgi:hypothetical protein
LHQDRARSAYPQAIAANTFCRLNSPRSGLTSLTVPFRPDEGEPCIARVNNWTFSARIAASGRQPKAQGNSLFQELLGGRIQGLSRTRSSSIPATNVSVPSTGPVRSGTGCSRCDVVVDRSMVMQVLRGQVQQAGGSWNWRGRPRAPWSIPWELTSMIARSGSHGRLICASSPYRAQRARGWSGGPGSVRSPTDVVNRAQEADRLISFARW